MNNLTFTKLKNIISIIDTHNISDSDLFDYFRLCGLNDIKYEDTAKNPLYFLSYSTEEEIKNGWFIKPFDLRPFINNIIQDYPNATFVVEKGIENTISNKNTKYIVVESIPNTIDKLFEYFKSKSSAKVVAVTGSVGKTTTVGLIEKVLKTKFNTLRIYSKRITPIILKANVINFLTPDIEFVVLENSIYYHNHVQILSSLLTPYIACMLNIESSHLGKEKLQTLDDICIYKSEILRNAQYGLINIDDEYLKKLDLKDHTIEYKNTSLFETKLEQLEAIRPNELIIKNNEFIINNEVTVKPFILSNLAKLQYYIAYKIGKIVGLNIVEIEQGLQDYTPVENRLNVKKAFNHEIIFDGDITTYERIKELANLEYAESYLVIRKVGSHENTFRISDIIDHFDKFTKVFIFSDIDYLEELKNHPKVTIVNNHDFMKNLNGKIIYHYSGYYRVWSYFDENNLNIYDRDIYPIIKPELPIAG